MLLAIAAVLLIAVTVLFTFSVRKNELPAPEAVSPIRHLEERKAAIYENLRDLQFEYRVGKLSDADYQQTKIGLQRELAGVLEAIELWGTPQSPKGEAKADPKAETRAAAAPESKTGEPERKGSVCPHCGATFEKVMKFCGNCGKGMTS